MKLPRALAPWATELAIFPEDLATAVGGLLRRLALAVGPPAWTRPGVEGEPDGFDDIARRGPYERLLASEWALADEVPAEFMRRAAEGEHAFHDLARRQAAQGRTSTVLFDSGPDQLGSPRLVHLAALILLARRAHAFGARFSWGVLQRPTGPLFQEITAPAVGELLRSRSLTEVAGDKLEGWRGRLDREGLLAGELWFVCGRRTAERIEGRDRRLLVAEDVIDPELRQLSVRVQRGRAARAQLVLDLPSDPSCTRLLRDPFATPAEAEAVSGERSDEAPASNLVFAANGAKLFARAADGALVDYVLGPRKTGTRVYRTGDGEPVVGAGWYRGQAVLLSRPGPELRIEFVSRRGRRWSLPPVPIGTTSPPPGERLHAVLSSDTADIPMLHYVNDAGNWIVIDAAKPRDFLIDRADVDAVSERTVPNRASRCFFYAACGGESWIVGARDDRTSGRTHSSPGTGNRAFFGFRVSGAGPAVALELGADRWRLAEIALRDLDVVLRNERVIEVPAHHRVVGVCCLRRCGLELLTLDPDRRRIVGWSSTVDSRPLLAADVEIEHATMCAGAPLLAYATVEGRVVVLNARTQAEVYVSRPGPS